jgi:hypothetical protein
MLEILRRLGVIACVAGAVGCGTTTSATRARHRTALQKIEDQLASMHGDACSKAAWLSDRAREVKSQDELDAVTRLREPQETECRAHSADARTGTEAPFDATTDSVSRTSPEITIPGFEDVVIGQALPKKDPMQIDGSSQKCGDVPDDVSGGTHQECQICRRVDFHCVQTVIRDGRVKLVSARLPEDATDRERLMKLIADAWGPPNSQVHNEAFDASCWRKGPVKAVASAFRASTSQPRPHRVLLLTTVEPSACP